MPSGPKVCIIALGSKQIPGMDRHATIAPVVKYTSERLLHSTVALHDLGLHEMDIVTAFLDVQIDVVVFMHPPAGLVDQSRPHLVCKIQNAVYGLKQVPRMWHGKIDD